MHLQSRIVLPPNFRDPVLNDSKKLTKAKRILLREKIQDLAIDYGIGVVDNNEIDKINILNASFVAMHLAITQLKFVDPELILVDGNRFKPYKTVKHVCIVKGDGKYMSIAAASILAKTCRDDLMTEFAKKYPQYDWYKNFGYPTKSHRNAIRKFGVTELHRKSFRLLEDQLQIFNSEL